MEGKDPGLVHDPELWPQASNLIIFEMAKRTYSLFKVFSVNLFLALGRRSSCYELGVESPRSVDDEVPISGFTGSDVLVIGFRLFDNRRLRKGTDSRCIHFGFGRPVLYCSCVLATGILRYILLLTISDLPQQRPSSIHNL
jgi:hypothetical protein